MAQTIIRTTDEMKKELQEEARKIGLTLNALIVVALRDWLQANR